MDVRPVERSWLPLTPERWPDLERLFGPKGACGGCWCMYWRLPRRQFEEGLGEPHRQALHGLVAEGQAPGLLLYADGAPVGWVSLGPRLVFGVLERSRILKRVDDRPVWSVVCFFVDRRHRGQGVMRSLLQAAVDYARAQGAEALEGYPIDASDERVNASAAYVGIAETFREAGFVEVARRSPKRPIMRLELAG